MLLIAAALAEELHLALDLCASKEKVVRHGISFWQAYRGGRTICFLKTGVGPRRSAANLKHLLGVTGISHIFVLGYGGALDPDLKLGDLVIVRKALDFSSLRKLQLPLEEVEPDGFWELEHSEDLIKAGMTAGISFQVGETLTSPYVIGDPSQKRLLYKRFHTSLVDMETAALAREATSRGIPLSCVRTVSDEADDSLLAPFSYDPTSSASSRAVKLISARNWVNFYRQWKERAVVAGESLQRFLSSYL